MIRKMLPFFLLYAFFAACSAGADTSVIRQTPQNESGSDAVQKNGIDGTTEPLFKKAGDVNVRLIVSGKVSDTEAAAQQIYYRIFIDQADAGRTTIGGSGDEKVFESRIEPNAHTVQVEKYILDEHKGRYVKVKNIDQPKPDSFDFTVMPDRILIIRLKDNGPDAQAEFTSDYERESLF